MSLYQCTECGDEWASREAARACELNDLHDAREAAYMPHRDPNLVRATD